MKVLLIIQTIKVFYINIILTITKKKKYDYLLYYLYEKYTFYLKINSKFFR